jgi:hypothetical protein
VDPFVLAVAETYYSGHRAWHVAEYETGTDSYLSDPMIGVPTIWPYSGTGIHTHHNSEDRPETIDERSLSDLTIIGATYLYTLAEADDRSLPFFAQLTSDWTHKMLHEHLTAAIDMAARSSGDERVRQVQAGFDQLEYVSQRCLLGIRSLRRLSQSKLCSKKVTCLEQDFLKDVQAARQKLRDLELRTPKPGVSSLVLRPDEAGAEQTKQLVVLRKRFGTITLDDLPMDQREGFPSGAWAEVPVKALYWCDGHRTVDEVIRLTSLETGVADFDFLGYFQFLAKHGYVELIHQTSH